MAYGDIEAAAPERTLHAGKPRARITMDDG
jgi:hypothetical protein